MSHPERFDRNIRLFGAEGQSKLRSASVVVVGVGGLGSALAQHLALLGSGEITLIEDQELDESNRNRFIGARHTDPVPGSKKVDLVARLITEIDSSISVTTIAENLLTEVAFKAIKTAEFVFGCFDEDGPRAVLNELCAAYNKHYFDLASDVPEAGSYGGRICSSWDGGACLLCMGAIDGKSVQRFFQSAEQMRAREAIYGIERANLERKGPSVSPINGVIASLAAAEFMAAVTGMRDPFPWLNYRGHLGTVTVAKSRRPDCFVCSGVRGLREEAGVERYLAAEKLRQARN